MDSKAATENTARFKERTAFLPEVHRLCLFPGPVYRFLRRPNGLFPPWYSGKVREDKRARIIDQGGKRRLFIYLDSDQCIDARRKISFNQSEDPSGEIE